MLLRFDEYSLKLYALIRGAVFYIVNKDLGE